MKLKFLFTFFIFTITAVVYAEDSDIGALLNQPGVYTLTNLHPDESRGQLYAANFQQDGLIPVCTEVELLDLGRKRLVFRVKSSGKEYKYDYHKAAGEDFVTHLNRYFGKDCNKDKAAKLSEIDQNGIKQGKALSGMSKQGVTLAIGYPPLSKTRTLDSTTWKYWFNRFNTFDVNFNDQGIVTAVVN